MLFIFIFIFIFSGVLAASACVWIRKFGLVNGHLYGLDMPQRFHVGAVPRLGGVAMWVACTAGWLLMASDLLLPGLLSSRSAAYWWVVATLAASAGLIEDLTHQLSARWRLLLTFLAGAVAVYLFDLQIGHLDISAFKPVWAAAPWLGTLLALLAVAGMPHAFNLIDGYNGLAGIVATICALSLGAVAWQVGDREIAAVMLLLAGATLGFLAWNYPRGLIFAGDGGAYLWGVLLAVAAVLLVQRHPQISPWFGVLLLIYPVWETAFSMYRKLARGQSPGSADALHFHQLIYRRIVRPAMLPSHDLRVRSRNNRTSPYLWGLTLLGAVPAVAFWHDTRVLMALSGLFIISYVVAYVSIVRFKVPRWLRR